MVVCGECDPAGACFFKCTFQFGLEIVTNIMITNFGFFEDLVNDHNTNTIIKLHLCVLRASPKPLSELFCSSLAKLT